MEHIHAWLSAARLFLVTTALPAVILFVVGIVLLRLVVRLLHGALEKTRLEPTARRFILTAAKISLYGLWGLILASRLGIDVTGIVALVSVLTLAVSLAVQNMLTNVLSGFTLLYTKPFHTGDFVEIAGQSGAVRSIGLTYTELATPDNKNIFLPNSAVTAAEIINYTVLGTRRVEVCVRASYDSPIGSVLEALQEAARVDTCLPDKPPFVALKSYGDSTVEYMIHIWVRSDDYWTTLFAINRRVKEIFDAKNLTMTQPHLRIHLEQ